VLTPADQRRRIIETARELDIPDTEAAQERVFGKVGPQAAEEEAKHLGNRKMKVGEPRPSWSAIHYLAMLYYGVLVALVLGGLIAWAVFLLTAP
jgi:hypothetical protein